MLLAAMDFVLQQIGDRVARSYGTMRGPNLQISRRTLLRSGALVGVGAALGACGLSSAPSGSASPTTASSTPTAAAKQYTFKMGGVFAPASAQTRTMQKFADLVAAKTNGQVTIQVFPSAQLGDETALLQTLLTPDFEGLHTLSISLLSTADPAVSVTNIPFLFRDLSHVRAYAHGSAFAAHRDRLIKSKGLRMLGAWDYGFSMLVSKKPIPTLPDIKGLKVRVAPTPSQVRMMQLLGANPTPIAFSEVFTSLQTGVIDAFTSTYDVTLQGKYYEVLKYNNLFRQLLGFTNPVIPEKFFQSLSPNLQKALVDAGSEGIDFNRQTIDQGESDAHTKLLAFGMIDVETQDRDKWVEGDFPMFQEYQQQNGPEGVALLKAVQDAK